ncbi:hypothetical protein FCIRC_12903 [Fusarium circinatum]|uniref:Uncharacterized protein n=1 Tax=Fusarium circinatum TaxID=48490 RepID=A0A8H5SX60_FUSCI|nr:hypothetical protein FCIRC_12903 [Fusarium circinatum]
MDVQSLERPVVAEALARIAEESTRLMVTSASGEGTLRLLSLVELKRLSFPLPTISPEFEALLRFLEDTCLAIECDFAIGLNALIDQARASRDVSLAVQVPPSAAQKQIDDALDYLDRPVSGGRKRWSDESETNRPSKKRPNSEGSATPVPQHSLVSEKESQREEDVLYSALNPQILCHALRPQENHLRAFHLRLDDPKEPPHPEGTWMYEAIFSSSMPESTKHGCTKGGGTKCYHEAEFNVISRAEMSRRMQSGKAVEEILEGTLCQRTLPGRPPFDLDPLRGNFAEEGLRILKDCGLLSRDSSGSIENEVNLEMRGEPGSTTARPTVIMLANWSTEKSDAFTRAAQQMSNYVDRFAIMVGSPIYVEIISLYLIQTKYYGPVNEPALSRTWDTVSDLIYSRLQSLPTTRGYLTCLALQKFGVNPSINTNPATVYISMDHRSDETSWYGVVSAVKDVLDRIAGWEHVQIHIEHNLNMPCAYDTLPFDPSKRVKGEGANKRITDDYNETVQIGDDFSPSRYILGLEDPDQQYNPGHGTLGCFIQIKTKSDTKWRTCVLTNHHVVRAAFDGFAFRTQSDGAVECVPPPEGSDLWKVDFDGYNASSKLGHEVASFESPSRTKHNFTIGVINEDIADLRKRVNQEERDVRTSKNKNPIRESIRKHKAEIASLEAEKKAKEAFIKKDKQILGNLIASSGFRRQVDRRRMDWALIELDPSREWSNNLPNEQAWRSKYRRVPARPGACGTPIQPRNVKSVESPWNLGPIFKVGSTTGSTTGEYRWEKEKVTIDHDAYLGNARLVTNELVFGPRADVDLGVKLCDHGDSGSVLFDNGGRIVALLFRGHKHEKSYDDGYGYVTPIEHVFDDIKDFTDITNIRIAK